MNRTEVLIPLNLENHSLGGLQFVAEMAAETPIHATLLSVIELNIFPLDRRVYDELSLEYRERLRTIMEHQAFDDHPRLSVRFGRPHEEIIAEARESGSELIVLSTHETPRRKWRFGATTVERIVREAPCPTVVFSDAWKNEIRNHRRMLPASLFTTNWPSGIAVPATI